MDKKGLKNNRENSKSFSAMQFATTGHTFSPLRFYSKQDSTGAIASYKKPGVRCAAAGRSPRGSPPSQTRTLRKTGHEQVATPQPRPREAHRDEALENELVLDDDCSQRAHGMQRLSQISPPA